MASQINASNSGFGGIVSTGDSSGQLQLQAAGTTIAALTSTGMAVTGTLSASGQATIPTINLTGGQITFPATQSASADANTLDDYEEGTWTPSWGVTGGSWTASSSAATYTKIGRQVTCNMSWTTSAISGSKVNTLNGLPFTSANNGTSPAASITANSIGLASYIPVGSIPANGITVNMQFSSQSTSGWADLVVSAISSTSIISMSFTYFTT